MIYHIDYELKKISSKIRTECEDEILNFANGEELCRYDFKKNSIVTDIRADGQEIVVTLKENKDTNLGNTAQNN